MQEINYDIFWRLSSFLDIKSIEKLSNTCKKLKIFKKESEHILIKRMFPRFPLFPMYEMSSKYLKESWIVLYKFYHWNYFLLSTSLERLVIFIINETNKIKRLQNTHEETARQEILYLLNFFNNIINNEDLNRCNLNYIFIHGDITYKKIVIEKIFNCEQDLICNFNLQHLFNSILRMQDLDYLSQFYLRYRGSQIMITREHIRKIIFSKNITFFDALVKMFIGDLIKLELYQSCIKECTNIEAFSKYLAV